MKKIKKFDNELIKRKNLILMLKKYGITRMNKDAVYMLEKAIIDSLPKLFRVLKEEMVTQGKKTLKREDVLNVLGKMKEEEFWEV